MRAKRLDLEAPFAVANAIHDNFTSPNESDSNFEPANVVDGLFAIARAIHRVADAMLEARKDVPVVQADDVKGS